MGLGSVCCFLRPFPYCHSDMDWLRGTWCPQRLETRSSRHVLIVLLGMEQVQQFAFSPLIMAQKVTAVIQVSSLFGVYFFYLLW